jgi:hypothetical protein
MTDQKRGRGKRRPTAVVERDQVTAAKRKLQDIPTEKTADELKVSVRSVQRLASQGMRGVLDDPAPKRAELFTTIASIFTEVLESLQEIHDHYKAAGKPVPTRVLQTKIQAAVGLARTCGFGTDKVFVDNNQLAPANISFTIVPRKEKIDVLSPAPPQLNAAPHDLPTPVDLPHQPREVSKVEPQVQVLPPVAPTSGVDPDGREWTRPWGPKFPKLYKAVPVPAETHRQRQVRLQMEENGGELILRGGPKRAEGLEDLG